MGVKVLIGDNALVTEKVCREVGIPAVRIVGGEALAEMDAESFGAMDLFQTGWFVESLLTQTLIVAIIRTRRILFLQSVASGPMLALTAFVMAIAVWLPYSFLARFPGLVPLPPAYFAWIVGFLGANSVLTHRVKSWFLRRFEEA